MIFEPEQMYETARELSMTYFEQELPHWKELSFVDQDHWQERADELNEARRND